jgi:glycerophosphoryl diester phosphodiesterase
MFDILTPMRKLIFTLMALSTTSISAPPRIEVHGHRGTRGMRPENTIPAFEYAIAHGVDVLELDMYVTKDNVVVVSHDPILHAPMCTGGPRAQTVIKDTTLAELRQWDCGAMKNPQFKRQEPVPGTRIPTLDEVFDLASKGTFRFNIETKSEVDHPEWTPEPHEFVERVLAVIRKHHLEKRVILQSFDFRTLHEMKKQAPEIELAALYSGKAKSFVDIGKEGGALWVSPEYHLVTKDQVSAAHAAGFKVVPWTANEPAEWDQLADAGVDAIITDYPADLVEHLKAKGLR